MTTPATTETIRTDVLVVGAGPGGAGAATHLARLGRDVLLVDGTKSGQVRETPVARFAGPDGSWYVVASANGAARNPSWYYNVAAHPDQVRIVVDGVESAVTAEQLHGADRAAAWHVITAAQPRFDNYVSKTDRDIPVIRLSPRAE